MNKKILLVFFTILCFPFYILAETILPDSGKTIEELFSEAAEYHLQNKLNDEVEVLSKAIQLNPQSAEAYYKRCLANYALRKFDKAREDAYKAELEGKVINLTFIKQLSKLNEDFDRGKKEAMYKSLEIALLKEGLSIKDEENATHHYYKNPQPDKLILIVKAILSDGWSIYDFTGFGPFTQLVAAVAHNNQNFLNDLKNQRSFFTGAQKDALDNIIYESENFRSREPNSPQGLDYLWAEFIATGSEEPVKKIISVLASQEPDSQMTRYSAQWSLKANAKQDKNVRKIIKDALASSQGELKKNLKKTLER